jgi:hypothetical protein
MDKSLILNRIKDHYNFKSDAEFARFLNITPQTLANWHRRNTFDYDIVYTKCEDIDPDWLFSGKEPMLREEKFHNDGLSASFTQEVNESREKIIEMNRSMQKEIERLIGLIESFH